MTIHQYTAVKYSAAFIIFIKQLGKQSIQFLYSQLTHFFLPSPRWPLTITLKKPNNQELKLYTLQYASDLVQGWSSKGNFLFADFVLKLSMYQPVTTLGELSSSQTQVSTGTCVFFQGTCIFSVAKWQSAASYHKQAHAELQAKVVHTAENFRFLVEKLGVMTAVSLHVRICCSHNTIAVARIMDLYHFYGDS